MGFVSKIASSIKQRPEVSKIAEVDAAQDLNSDAGPVEDQIDDVRQRPVSRLGTYLHDRPVAEHDDTQLPVFDASPCIACQGLNIKDLVSPGGYRHHGSQKNLLVSARSGCEICRWICEVHFPEIVGDQYITNPGAYAPNGESDSGAAGIYNYPLVLRYDPALYGLTITPTYRMRDNAMSLFADEGHSAASQIAGRRVARTSTLETTLQRFGPLLSRLAPRTKDTAPPLPKRAIDVGEPGLDVIFLREFKDDLPRAHYICLSHRWERSKPLTTTDQTLASRQGAIQVKQLSPTFRDAVRLTRAFGIRYLWIDSLCIIQNSRPDWETESANMGLYYSKSWLTIAAALDGNLADGLFGLRYPLNDEIPYYRLKMPSTHNQLGSTVYFTGQDELRWDSRAASLLYTRGWTLQEEALAPRFLSFQPRQMSLRIGEHVYHECNFREDIEKTGYLSAINLNPASWSELVEDYSRRQLTRDEDKLPALSGLAHQYLIKQKDIYLAGLWLSSLTDHLCWCVVSSDPHSKSMKPAYYRAPSWSWACLNGSINFDRVSKPLDSQSFEIVTATTTAAGLDPLGQVTSGSISIRGILCRQLWKRKAGYRKTWYYAYPSDLPTDRQASSANTPYSTATLILDVEDWSTSELEIWSLPLKDQFALALQLAAEGVHSSAIFKRVGAICWRSKKDDAAHAELETIVIV